ncbi:MAG: nitroreductase family protein [Anaerolineae bacterium]
MQTTPPLEHNELYQAMMNWRSVRRFDQQPVPEQLLDNIQAEARKADALVPQNRFELLLRDIVTGDDLVAALGAYGRILSPKHLAVPYVVGETHPLTDLGYRTHQVVVKMTGKGLGGCYIGSLGRETTLRARLVLRRQTRIAAVVIFGYPAQALPGRTLNTAMRHAMGSNRRRPLETLFFEDDFQQATEPPKALRPVLEAGRRAPSAHNVQPCRFLWRSKTLYLFVTRENPKYGKGVKQHYRYFDAGLCMANISLALQALDLTRRWELLTPSDRNVPTHPQTLEPVARISLPTL